MALLSLPSKTEELARAIKTAENAVDSHRAVHKVNWLIDHHYLRGAREFRVIDPESGTVQATYKSPDAQEVRFEDALVKMQAELGRLLRLDTAPKCSPDGFGLDSMRKAGIAQAVLTYLTSPLSNEEIKSKFILGLLQYGTMGLGVWEMQSPGVRAGVEVEVIPPWELGSIPANPSTLSDVLALMRTRWVALDWLKTKSHLKFPNAEEEMEPKQVPYGCTLSADGTVNGDPSAVHFEAPPNSHPTGSTRATGGDYQLFVRLSETWVFGPRDTVARWIVKAGNAILVDKDFEKQASTEKDFYLPPLPIGVARYYYTGGFYGRAYVAPLIPINRESETMLTNLFRNMKDLDLFGILALPNSAGINVRQLKEKPDQGPRLLFYEPDYTVPQAQPFKIEPTNMGDFPGKVANFATQITDRLANQSPMMGGEAPGRVDSASGLGMLWETNSQSRGAIAESIRGAYRIVYRAALAMAHTLLSDSPILQLATLDDACAGVVIDPTTGSLSLEDNPLPLPDEVRVDIKDANPKFFQQRVETLIGMLKLGIITPREFRLRSYKEQLDLPVENKAELENYRKAVFNVVLLFNDGQTPGRAVGSEATDNPEIHLMVLTDFMAKPEFTLASQPVRAAFEQLKTQYEAMMGGFPEQMPYPEDMPEAQQMAQKMAQQRVAQGFGGPPDGGRPQMSMGRSPMLPGRPAPQAAPAPPAPPVLPRRAI